MSNNLEFLLLLLCGLMRSDIKYSPSKNPTFKEEWKGAVLRVEGANPKLNDRGTTPKKRRLRGREYSQFQRWCVKSSMLVMAGTVAFDLFLPHKHPKQNSWSTSLCVPSIQQSHCEHNSTSRMLEEWWDSCLVLMATIGNAQGMPISKHFTTMCHRNPLSRSV